MFDKGTKVKVIQWKKQSFQKMVLKQLDTHMQKRESRHTLHPWITNINIKCKTIKLQEDDTGQI